MELFNLIIFSSRDTSYKEPYGAVSAGTVINLTVKIPADMNANKVIICIHTNTGEKYEQEMACTNSSGDIYLYKYAYKTYSEKCYIMWYNFKIEANSEIYYLNCGKSGGNAEISSALLTPWQQTVYLPAQNNKADWYGKGITYHIFIDRFNRVSIPDNQSGKYISERIIHTDWNELPVYLPDENGEVLNNDFFGGSLKGIIEKLGYLSELSVTTIYLSPIFEAESNHRYDTGDYKKIDPMIGTEDDLKELCQKAAEYGMRVMLDGVFNHTGCNSRYFNRREKYDSTGAYQAISSPYFNWYTFDRWPDLYSSWWGIYTLPQVNEENPEYRDFIINNRSSVIKHWLSAGVSGWRLDVADELPDDFIAALSASARAEKDDTVIIGEVWEDASSKISYDKYRNYILNGSLDGVTNYPLRNGILAFLRGGDGAEFAETIEKTKENYPKHVFHSLMNHIGTHDTPRILTALGCNQDFTSNDKSFRASYFLSSEDRYKAIQLLKLASFIQFTMPGSPTVYYGDEAGTEGFEDPLNRKTYPWGKEEPELLDWYRKIGRLRKEVEELNGGELSFEYAGDGLIVYSRYTDDEIVILAVNRSDKKMHFDLKLNVENDILDMISGKVYSGKNGSFSIEIMPVSCIMLK